MEQDRDGNSFFLSAGNPIRDKLAGVRVCTSNETNIQCLPFALAMSPEKTVILAPMCLLFLVLHCSNGPQSDIGPARFSLLGDGE